LPEVKQERTSWRDKGLSERHRLWGWDCPAIDIDFLLLEFDEGKARALVEYKNEHAKTQRTGHPSYKALIDLGDRAGVPVFACRYSDDFVKWVVFPLNEKAKPLLPPEWGTEMTEREYVSFLYELRGKEAPGILLSQLNG